MNNILLIGFMGAGKTTIGGLLAEKKKLRHVDLDELIVQEIGMPISDYFALYGEDSFREKETEALTKAIKQEQIISTGGGIILKAENRELLKNHPKVIYLKTEATELIRRLEADQKNVRPLVVSKTPTEILAVYEPRIPLYEESARIVIETTGKTPQQIVTDILTKVGE